MIFELHIKDFILIEEALITFKEGLNIITGETGAGKSMILGAISLVLGGTASKDAIRQSCDKANIKCTFYANESANDCLASSGIPVDHDWIVISREINAKSKSISRVNGHVVTLNVLKDLTAFLLDIHGQFDNQALFNKLYQIELVDDFGGDKLLSTKKALREVFGQLHKEQKALDKLSADHEDKEKQIDFLDYQINEIDTVALRAGEDEEIENSFSYYANLEAIKAAFNMAEEAFHGEFREGVLSVLSKLRMTLNGVSKYDQHTAAFSERLDEHFYLIEDLARDMQKYSDTLSVDPEKRYELEERLNAINKLKAKYGKNIETILAYREELSNQRAYYDEIDAKVSAHQKAVSKLAAEYDTLADTLSKQREKSSKAFKNAVTAELSSLNMKAAQFDIEFSKSERRTELGNDLIEFLIATNPGQPLKPIKRIVSGGELSRLMLAIKVVMGNVEGMPTQIFDEIDAGISGITASVVGEKLYQLSLQGQIICITHLPQIAVFADYHYCIQKSADQKKAQTEVREIEGEAIINEIGRLVGGVAMTDSTRKHVEDMLKEAQSRKGNL